MADLDEGVTADTDFWDIAAGPVPEQVRALVQDVQSGARTAAEARSLLVSWAGALVGLFGSYDTVRLVGYISAMFWRSPVGVETDLKVRPRLQYLYSLQIEQSARKQGSAPSVDVAFRVLNGVRSLFELNRACLAAEATTGSREDVLRLLVRIEQMEERHNGYVQHLAPLVRTLAEGVAAPFVEHFGWHPLDLWALASETSRITEKRLNDNRRRRIGDRPTDDDKRRLMLQSLNFDYLAFVWNPISIASLIYLQPDEPSSVEKAARLLNDLRLRSSGMTEVLLPDAVPARAYAGFDRIDEGWLLPQPLLLAQYWVEIIGDLIAAGGDVSLARRWENTRSKTTETLTRDALRRALPGADVLHSVKAPSSGDGETDCLVISKDRTQAVVVECKGGNMSAPARRGATDRLEKFTKQNIEKAGQQIDWMRRLLLAGPVKLDPKVGRQVTVDVSSTRAATDPIVAGVVVTLERVDALAMLEKTATNPRGQWVVCLADLLMVVEAFKDEVGLINYIEDRYILESLEGWLVYEKDALGFYLTTGGFFKPSPSRGWPRLGPRGRFEDFTFSDISAILGYGQLLDARFSWPVKDGLPGASPR